MFSECIAGLAILDPTCGTGAFLLAALRLLQPLQEAGLARLSEKGILHPRRNTNGHEGEGRSCRLRTLYGVDLSDEAVEICKLRLLLAAIAPVTRIETLEPLPDLDRQIQVGNALVGFTGRALGSF